MLSIMMFPIRGSRINNINNNIINNKNIINNNNNIINNNNNNNNIINNNNNNNNKLLRDQTWSQSPTSSYRSPSLVKIQASPRKRGLTTCVSYQVETPDISCNLIWGYNICSENGLLLWMVQKSQGQPPFGCINPCK